MGWGRGTKRDKDNGALSMQVSAGPVQRCQPRGTTAGPGAQAESEVPVTLVESPSRGTWVCSSGDILAQQVPRKFTG